MHRSAIIAQVAANQKVLENRCFPFVSASATDAGPTRAAAGLVELGDRIGINFQQIQKYETGTNRMGASRMWEIAAALDVPVSFFFEGLRGQAPDTREGRGEFLTDEEALELVRAYYAFPENQRRQLSDLACVLDGAA
jgi:transcriptional regulator with XRE-family HTH domain